MQQGKWPGGGKRGKEGRRILAGAMFQPIGQEQAFKPARIAGAQRIQRGQRCRTIRRPRLGAHHGQACGGFFGGQEGKRVGLTLLRRRGQ